MTEASNQTETTKGPDQTGIVLTDEQRAPFRTAGFWMALVGWAEVIFGIMVGLVWLLAALGVLPDGPREVTSWEWGIAALEVFVCLVIGVLTLIAARSFCRAGRDSSAGVAGVTAAVADLAELYERQVWVAFAVLCIVIGRAIAIWR